MNNIFTEALNSSTDYSEFKYVLQDTGNYYIGSKYTYADMIELDTIPFKFKAIIDHYFSKDTELDTTLESQLYYMTKDQFSYQTYLQLKAKVKVSILVPKKKLFSKEEKYVYEEQIIPLKEFEEMNLAQKKSKGVIVRELVISKLALMGFSV